MASFRAMLISSKTPKPPFTAHWYTGPGRIPLLRFKGIGSQHPGGIHIDVEGHVPHGPSEHRRQVFRQHVLPGGLGAGQQQVLPAQQGGNGLFPHVFAIIMEVRDGDPGLEFRRRGEFFPIGLQSPEQVRIDMFTL